MTELAEYERRIAYALERIGRGVETLNERRAATEEALQLMQAESVEATPDEDLLEAALSDVVAEAVAEAVSDAGLAELRAELEAERAANALLSDRVRAIREKQETTLAALEKRLAQATRALEAVQVEANRLKRANGELIDVNRALVDGAGRIDPQLVNRSMQAELEAMRAARAWEASELADVISGLAPIVAAHVKGQPAGGAENG